MSQTRALGSLGLFSCLRLDLRRACSFHQLRASLVLLSHSADARGEPRAAATHREQRLKSRLLPAPCSMKSPKRRSFQSRSARVTQLDSTWCFVLRALNKSAHPELASWEQRVKQKSRCCLSAPSVQLRRETRHHATASSSESELQRAGRNQLLLTALVAEAV